MINDPEDIVEAVMAKRRPGVATIHPMAVHVEPSGEMVNGKPSRRKFKVVAVGHKVKPTWASVGDHFSSSDLDDLSQEGHKVKEVK